MCGRPRFELMPGFGLLLLSVAAWARPAAAQSLVSAPASVSLTVIVPERIPHDAGPRTEEVARAGAGFAELRAIVGLAAGRASRLDVRLDGGASDAPGSRRILVRSIDGRVVPLAVAHWVTVADTRDSTRVGESTVAFRIESNEAVLLPPFAVPIVYRLVVGDGESARGRSYFTMLGMLGGGSTR